MITSVSTATAVKAASERRRRQRVTAEASEQSRHDKSNASSDSEISALDDGEAPDAGQQDTGALPARDVAISASGHAAQANEDARLQLPSAASTRPAAPRRGQAPPPPSPPPPSLPQQPQQQSLQPVPAPEPPPARKEPATQHTVSRDVDNVLFLTRDKFGASARVERKVMEEVLQGVVEAADESESARTNTESVHRRRGPLRLVEPQEIVARLDNALRSPLSRQEMQVRDVYTFDLFEHNPNWAAFLISSTDKKAKVWEERREQAVTCCEQWLFSRVRQYIYMTLSYPDYSLLAYLFGVFMILIILLNTITFCIESIPHYRHTPVYDALMIVDYVCMGFFTVEYLMRLICCPSLWRFSTSFSNFIDLVAILPFYIELVITGTSVAFQTRIVRLLRILRVLRIVKSMPKLRHLTLVADTLKTSTSVLVMLVFLLAVLLVVFGTIFFFVEPSTFDSIPQAMYYAQVTLTTTGYGDLYPVTSWGRFVAGLTMLLCIVVVSLPIAVIGGNFSEKWADYKSFKSAVERSEQVGSTDQELKGALETYERALDDVIDKMQQDETSMERNLEFVRQELAAARAALDRGGGHRSGAAADAQGTALLGVSRSVIRRMMSSTGGGPGSLKTSSFTALPPAASSGATLYATVGVSMQGPEELAAASCSNAQRLSVGFNVNDAGSGGGGDGCQHRPEPLAIGTAPSNDLRTATSSQPRGAGAAGDMEACGPLQGGGAAPRGRLQGIVRRVLQHQARRRSGNGALPSPSSAGGGGGGSDCGGGKPSVILSLGMEEPAAKIPYAAGGGFDGWDPAGKTTPVSQSPEPAPGGPSDASVLATPSSPPAAASSSPRPPDALAAYPRPNEPMALLPPRPQQLSLVLASTPSVVPGTGAPSAISPAESVLTPIAAAAGGGSRAGSARKNPIHDGLVDRVSKSVAHFFVGNTAAAAAARTGSMVGQRPTVDAAELAAAREALNLATDGCARASDLKVRQATLAALAGLLRFDDVPEKLEKLEEQYRALRCWQEELGPLAERMWCVRDALDTLAWSLQEGLAEVDRSYVPASPEERCAEDERLGAVRPGKQALSRDQGLGAGAVTAMWLARTDDNGGELGGVDAPAPAPVQGLGLGQVQES